MPATNAVSSVHGRTGAVVAASGDYTWAMINKALSSLGDIADVDFSSAPSTDDVLTYNGSKWVPKALSVIAGPQGPIGLTGAKGDTGETGAIGATGLQGPIGLTGATGETGPQGPIGLTGAMGPMGLTGLNGLDGAKGDPGETGPVGATGLQGPIGLTGAKGDPGETGATGLQGPIGLTGAKGDPGETGPAGATGPQGPIGLTGAKGDKGDPGTSGTPQDVLTTVLANFSLENLVSEAISAGDNILAAFEKIQKQIDDLIGSKFDKSGGTISGATTFNSGIKLSDTLSPHSIEIKQPSTLAGSYSIIMPLLAPTPGQVLAKSDNGDMEWKTLNMTPAVGSITDSMILSIEQSKIVGLTDSLNGKVSSVSASDPLVSSGGITPNISIPKSSTTASGYLSSTDWDLFNNKQDKLLSTSQLLVGSITASSLTLPALYVPLSSQDVVNKGFLNSYYYVIYLYY